MNNRFAAPVASAATAILLLGACSDDDDSSSTTTESSTTTSEPAVGLTLAKGEDVEMVGDITSGLRNQTLNIDARQQRGEATGEIRFDDNVIRVECAETVDGRVVLGGTATAGSYLETGALYALIITEGDADRVALIANEDPVWTGSSWWGEVPAGSCDEFVELIPSMPSIPGLFVDVEDGYDIETG